MCPYKRSIRSINVVDMSYPQHHDDAADDDDDDEVAVEEDDAQVK